MWKVIEIYAYNFFNEKHHGKSPKKFRRWIGDTENLMLDKWVPNQTLDFPHFRIKKNCDRWLQSMCMISLMKTITVNHLKNSDV